MGLGLLNWFPKGALGNYRWINTGLIGLRKFPLNFRIGGLRKGFLIFFQKGGICGKRRGVIWAPFIRELVWRRKPERG